MRKGVNKKEGCLLLFFIFFVSWFLGYTQYSVLRSYGEKLCRRDVHICDISWA